MGVRKYFSGIQINNILPRISTADIVGIIALPLTASRTNYLLIPDTYLSGYQTCFLGIKVFMAGDHNTAALINRKNIGVPVADQLGLPVYHIMKGGIIIEQLVIFLTGRRNGHNRPRVNQSVLTYRHAVLT